jgi:hypothetical protein
VSAWKTRTAESSKLGTMGALGLGAAF